MEIQETRICDLCKKEFIPRRSHQRFCDKCKEKDKLNKKGSEKIE